MGVFVTELSGYRIVFPEQTTTTGGYYLFTENFYSGNLTSMTALETLVYGYITTRTSGSLPDFISDYLLTVYMLSKADQFYHIPLYIQIIDNLLQTQYREIDAPSMSF
jgi:hypothetical protein